MHYIISPRAFLVLALCNRRRAEKATSAREKEKSRAADLMAREHKAQSLAPRGPHKRRGLFHPFIKPRL